jgi:small GTP-binding protein
MAKSTFEILTSELEIIRELTILVGKEFVHDKKFIISPSFNVDTKGQIIGVSLSNCKIKNAEKVFSALKKLKDLKELKLGLTNITDLSPIVSLTKLQVLDLNNISIPDLTPLRTLGKLRYLDLMNCTIDDPSKLADLNSLTHLNLSYSSIVDLAPLANLTALQGLQISYTRVFDLSPLAKLTSLTDLNITGSAVTSLSPLAPLKALEDLKINETNIKDFTPLAHLTGLLYLSLAEGKITDLTPLSHLKKLAFANLFETNISDLTPIQDLKDLFYLDLSGTKITDIAPLANLTNLEGLNLANTNIADISPLQLLPILKDLNLNKANIRDISSLRNFKALKMVYLWGNPLTHLPPWITKLGMDIRWEENENMSDLYYERPTIILGHNPLQSPPPEIVARGKAAINTWFTEDKIYLNEVKVLLVGQGEVGKTSLVKSIKGEKIDLHEPATHNINISAHPIPFKRKNIKLNFWDFGGQDVMHSTHQFFLSKRCIYMLVLDGRKDEDPEYWLKHIESFGGNSPVLVVMNKMDTNPGYDVDRRFLQSKYPFIAGFFKTACAKKSQGVIALKKGLLEALDKVELLTTPWPGTWVAIKNRIESMKDDFISQKKFVQLCEENGITDPKAQQVLADYLNDLGVVVHFNDMQLTDLHILQPRWASQAAYRIITSKRVAEHSGLLKVEWLPEILKKKKKTDYTYKEEHHRYILELMQKFELCYTINHGKHYLIPELLNIQQPEIPIQTGPLLKFYFQYEDLLPRSIISRFIVRMHEDIQDDLRWRTGVVLKSNLFDATVIVIADIKERRVTISVCGNQRREYFAIVRNTFHSLHKTFEKMHVTEYVPLPGFEGHSVGYTNLLGHEKNSIDVYFEGTLQKSFKVKALLDGIESENIRKGEFKWDCFLCHSSRDKTTIRKIATDLRIRNIRYWLDEEQIDPGDNTIDKITEGLQNSRNIIPCISKDELQSGWAKNEYQSVLTKIISGNTQQRVIPFILDDTPDDKVPHLLNNYRFERYLIAEQYERLLEFLSKKKH